MSFPTAYATNTDLTALAADLRDQLGAGPFRAVLFFASSGYEPAPLAAALQQAFGDTPTCGCTTAGELVTGRMLKGAVVAMGFPSDSLLDCAVEVVPAIATDASQSVAGAMDRLGAHFGAHPRTLSHEQHVGIILVDGLRAAEEAVMDAVGNLTDVPFVGGSAGDDLKFEITHVFAGGEAHTDAAVLALLKPAVKFEILKTQSFRVCEARLKVTRVDEPSRTVSEFNGKPAAQAYAEALSTPVDKLSDQFIAHPLGLIIDQEPYVRSAQQVQGTDVVFYCQVKEGMELAVLEGTDIVQDTKAALDARLAAFGPVDGLINFHCILRTLDLEGKGLTEAYGALFADLPAVGFSTYGEQYLGHINQTSTMLLFGK